MPRLVALLLMLVTAREVAAHPQPTLVVTGNKIYTTDQIRAGIDQTLLEPSGAISQEAVERFTLLISAFYWDRGYANVKVKEPRIDHHNHRIEYALEEGPRFTIGTVRVTGKLVETERRIMAMLKVKPGDVFSREKIASDRTRLNTYYEDRSYAFANVLPLTKVDLAKLTISLTFEIVPGEPSFIEAIDVVGNTKTDTGTIRNMLVIAPKQAWHGTRLEQSRRRLAASFPDVVVSSRRGTTPNGVRVIVEVNE